MITFDNSFSRLSDTLSGRLGARVAPQPAAAPRLLALNGGLADMLGLDPVQLRSAEGVAMLAGNHVPQGAAPFAQAYAGHQFGNFVPQLGDGRALLLGEVVSPDGRRFDIQLKGAGVTPFSRRGDGRAAIGPVLREYLVSEFMAAVGVPTTRALAAVGTGDLVWRDEGGLQGAVLTRVAASHIRVGTFQFHAVRGDVEALEGLTAHVISRHYPDAQGAAGLLDGVMRRQADTIARWMALGFVHGVMNTDNMAISGETIDYGPCAFMDQYHPETVFSFIDKKGRYAWVNQPQIAVWNLAQLASALLPLMGGEDAVPEATRIVHEFAPVYQQAFLHHFGNKLGLRDLDEALIERLLGLMAAGQADFTRVFAGLADGSAGAEFSDPGAFNEWQADWHALNPDENLMRQTNPLRIPRNHQVDAAIRSAQADDLGPFEALLSACLAPFDYRDEWAGYAKAPMPEQRIANTFCGT